MVVKQRSRETASLLFHPPPRPRHGRDRIHEDQVGSLAAVKEAVLPELKPRYHSVSWAQGAQGS